MLSTIIFIPILTAIIFLFINKKHEKVFRILALIGAALPLILSLITLATFSSEKTWQLITKIPWIPEFGINYLVALDGLSLSLVLLTTLLTFLVVIYSWNHTKDPKKYFGLLLLLETGLLGAFGALDLILFYIFFEISLVPMYFLIGIFGEKNRKFAAIKFFLYTLAGSLAILLGFFILYFSQTPHTFNFLEIQSLQNSNLAIIAFFALAIGFAIKLPLFPFHTWLPLAHTEAPTGGSVLLAAILLKMGGYGFIRFLLPIFPITGAIYAWIFAILAIISIIYGSLVALAQTDFKKLIAYSSIGHMGFVILGIAAFFASKGQADIALKGATLQMLTHGLITGMLFFLAGMLYKRTKERHLGKLGGLWLKMPVYGGILIFTCFASLGLPGLAGFISEFLVLLGSFETHKIYVGLALIGIILTATYFLRALQKILMGKLNPNFNQIKDLTKREILVLMPLILLILFIGIYPGPILELIQIAN